MVFACCNLDVDRMGCTSEVGGDLVHHFMKEDLFDVFFGMGSRLGLGLFGPEDGEATVVYALRQPPGCQLREMVVCSSEESSWP